MNKTSLISLSGGMDSTTLLYEYESEIGLAISFDYGSNHAAQEIKKAKLSCERLGVPHQVINLEQAFEGIKSALTSGRDGIPEGHYSDETMKATVVPFRNGIMNSILAGIADSNGFDKILVASHFGDDAVYADCRTEFNIPMAAAIKAGTDNNVILSAPFASILKKDIADLGEAIGVPWEQTYSCYKGGDVHCGRCSTCVERLEALEGKKDDTEYLDTRYWRTVCQP